MLFLGGVAAAWKPQIIFSAEEGWGKGGREGEREREREGSWRKGIRGENREKLLKEPGGEDMKDGGRKEAKESNGLKWKKGRRNLKWEGRNMGKVKGGIEAESEQAEKGKKKRGKKTMKERQNNNGITENKLFTHTQSNMLNAVGEVNP